MYNTIRRLLVRQFAFMMCYCFKRDAEDLAEEQSQGSSDPLHKAGLTKAIFDCEKLAEDYLHTALSLGGKIVRLGKLELWI